VFDAFVELHRGKQSSYTIYRDVAQVVDAIYGGRASSFEQRVVVIERVIGGGPVMLYSTTGERAQAWG